MSKTRRITSIITAAVLVSISVLLCSCSKGGKVSVTIGDWPADTDTMSSVYEEYLKQMNEKYPDIEIIPDTSSGTATSYLTRAISGQLPNLYVVSYTEAANIIKSGFCADITDACKEYNYAQSLNPLVLDKVKDGDKIYGIPQTAYALGLICNKELFEQAGLVNADGTLQYPQTYDELAKTAKTIKEKTNQAGVVFPTMNNQGGWIFTNVAWSYGVDFMEQDTDGKWKATFDTPECVAALQYIKDLKWVHNVLPDNAFVDIEEERKLFASNQAAMYIIHPTERMLVKNYSMNKDNICFARVPEGPAGRYTLMGGNYYAVSPQSTPEQIDALFKFLEIKGHSPNVTEKTEESLSMSMKKDNDENVPVMRKAAFPLWINNERTALDTKLREMYANVPDENFADYSSFIDVMVHEEEPQCAQELYSILDSGIQKVLTEKDADCASIVKEMANDFQKNHLDKLD